MRIATWNVNSIRAREAFVAEWLAREEPDVLCIQETKVVDEDFPVAMFDGLGYEVHFMGQKTYNGVAIASRRTMTDLSLGLRGDGDSDGRAEPRLIAATIEGLRVFSAYIPNGKSLDSPHFAAKLSWLARLRDTLASDPLALTTGVVCGDFNVAPDARDVWSVEAFQGHTHFHPDEHRALQKIMDLGFVDAYRLHETASGKFSWWDYRAGSFHKNQGMRIDLVLLAGPIGRRCTAGKIDRDARKKSLAGPPSDHAPVVIDLADP